MVHKDVAEFLADPATHGLDQPVEQVRTHGALVFLAGPTAWKIKRPVVYDYLDFSTPERRRAMLQRELDLNRPLAPGIYDRLVPITRQADGSFSLDGGGEPVEWALRMWRFPAAAELSHIAARGGLDDALAARLAQQVAQMHARAPVRDADGARLIGDILAQLENALGRMSDTLDGAAIGAFRDRATAAFERVQPLLRARGNAGWVRRCHGDLHLRNIVCIEGIPTPFDALEFDERLATIDVLYDLAFLLMDLRHEGLNRAANIVMNRYLHHSGAIAHLDALAALPLFLGLRAAIRAMVGVQRASGSEHADAALRDSARYLAEACAALTPASPVLIAVGGVSGTGKTVLATALAPELGAASGAVHLRSDLVRKAMFGWDETRKLPKHAYARETSDAVYADIRCRARHALQAGHAVVLDAVHLSPDERTAARTLANECGVPFFGLWLQAAPDVLESRVTARTGDASDADAAVVRQQLEAQPEAGDWWRIDASGPPAATLERARRIIGSG